MVKQTWQLPVNEANTTEPQRTQWGRNVLGDSSQGRRCHSGWKHWQDEMTEWVQDERTAGVRTAGEERCGIRRPPGGRGELPGGEEGLKRNRGWSLQDFQALTGTWRTPRGVRSSFCFPLKPLYWDVMVCRIITELCNRNSNLIWGHLYPSML